MSCRIFLPAAIEFGYRRSVQDHHQAGYNAECTIREVALVPNVSEPLNRLQSVAGELIIRVCVDENTAFRRLVTVVNLASQFGKPIDALAVAKPAEIGPVRGDGIKLRLGRVRHQYEGDAVINAKDWQAPRRNLRTSRRHCVWSRDLCPCSAWLQ